LGFEYCDLFGICDLKIGISKRVISCNGNDVPQSRRRKKIIKNATFL
jgi:hypothetical protein